MTLFLGLALLALIVMSAFFSGIETGLVSVSRAKIRRLAAKNDPRAAHIAKFLEHPDEFIGTILVGNNIAHVVISVVTTWFFLRLFEDHSNAVLASFALVTPLLLIFGEILPKAYFRQRPHAATLRFIRFFVLVKRLLGPIARLILAFIYFFIPRRGEAIGPQVEMRRQEIQSLVREGEKLGFVEDDEKQMIDAVFDMAKTTVREVMVPRVEAAAVNDKLPPKEIIEFVLANNYTRYPVYHETPDQIRGVLHISDLLADGELNVTKIAPPFYIPETARIDDALEALRSAGQHMAIVVDEYGGTSGIVTIEDLLEELVGEIHDEFDEETTDIFALGPGRWRVDASMTVAEVIEELDLPIRAEAFEAETVGGLVMEKLGRIPTVGDAVLVDGVGIQVLTADKRRVLSVEVNIR